VSELPNLFPALDSATEAALTESIKRFGVLVPVARDQHGRTLDGHHRSRIADDLGVKYRVDVIKVADAAEARDIAATLNTDRRQMDAEQRREIAASLHEAGHSLRAIGGAVGVSQEQVRRDLSGVTDVTPPDRVLGKDGKSYPAKRPTVVAAKNEREAERAQDALEGTDLPDVPVLDVKRVERLRREQEAERKRAVPVDAVVEEQDIATHHCDFRDLGFEVDLIGAAVITDPPYPREFLREWGDMAFWALTRGCEVLVAMCGQSILPDAIEQILEPVEPPLDHHCDEQRWEYRWCGAYLTSGPATRVWNAEVGTSWKPILVFDRGQEREFLTTDVFRSTGDDKQHHHWGQNEAGIAALVEAFTEPGDVVVDPFMGGGTTAVVCKALGRSFVGCDIDAAAVEATRSRLAA
jgi:ParB-like chromosome segregation protein Spo0J